MNYDLSAKSKNYYSQARLEIFDFIPLNAKSILDIGCGEAVFSAQLKQRNKAEVWGIEFDVSAADIARKKIDKVLVGDALGIIPGLPDNYFDCIVFNDVLEHLVDPFKALIEIKNKLKTGGVVVCSIPNIRYFFVLKDLLFKKQWRYEDSGVLDKTHLRFFTKNSILDMFNVLGYQILEIKGINKSTSKKLALFNILTFGYFSDTRYSQFACVAKPLATHKEKDLLKLQECPNTLSPIELRRSYNVF